MEETSLENQDTPDVITASDTKETLNSDESLDKNSKDLEVTFSWSWNSVLNRNMPVSLFCLA